MVAVTPLALVGKDQESTCSLQVVVPRVRFQDDGGPDGSDNLVQQRLWCDLRWQCTRTSNRSIHRGNTKDVQAVIQPLKFCSLGAGEYSSTTSS